MILWGYAQRISFDAPLPGAHERVQQELVNDVYDRIVHLCRGILEARICFLFEKNVQAVQKHYTSWGLGDSYRYQIQADQKGLMRISSPVELIKWLRMASVGLKDAGEMSG